MQEYRLGFIACLLVFNILKHQSCFLKRLDSDLMCLASALANCSVSTCFSIVSFTFPAG